MIYFLACRTDRFGGCKEMNLTGDVQSVNGACINLTNNAFLGSDFCDTSDNSSCIDFYSNDCASSLDPDVIVDRSGHCYLRQNRTYLGFDRQFALAHYDANHIRSSYQSPSEQYFYNKVLKTSRRIPPSASDIRHPDALLALSLSAVWLIVFFCLSQGIKSSGKAVYITATLPYVFLLILLIRGVTLPGYEEGIRFYIVNRDWSKLRSSKVWFVAATQILFSLGVSQGGIVALSSYSRFHTNTLRDAFLIALSDSLTSFLAGFSIFSILGHMAYRLKTTVPKVVQSGYGLAFIAYAEALSQLPGRWSTCLAIMFFFMIIALGLDSEFGLVECVATALSDEFRILRKRKKLVLFLLCSAGFCVGFLLVTPGGYFLVNFLDHFVSGWGIVCIAFCEITALNIYGSARFMKDVQVMLNFNPISNLWRFYFAVSPFAILFVIVFFWIVYEHPKFIGQPYPASWESIGLSWSFVLVAIMLICMLSRCAISVWTNRHSCAPWRLYLHNAFKPDKNWGPALAKHRLLIDYAPEMEGSATDMQTTRNSQISPALQSFATISLSTLSSQVDSARSRANSTSPEPIDWQTANFVRFRKMSQSEEQSPPPYHL